MHSGSRSAVQSTSCGEGPLRRCAAAIWGCSGIERANCDVNKGVLDISCAWGPCRDVIGQMGFGFIVPRL